MSNFETHGRENDRRRKLSILAAAGLVALGGFSELSRANLASARDKTPESLAEKAKNPMINRIDSRMIHMITQLKALKKNHPRAVGIVNGVFKGEQTTDYILTMREKNLQGQNSYSVLYMVTPKGKDLPFYSVFVPNSPVIAPDITARPKPSNMQEILRLQQPNEYIIDSYGPDGNLVGKVPVTNTPITDKNEAAVVNNVYDDLTSFMEEFIQMKTASYKPKA
ncbi:MAG: hypothetical protein ACREGG_01370 [Candidatus Saccharimonadales bacterium]